MMEKDDFLKDDDFLRDLIRRSPLDHPSDDFVDRVMANIQISPETETVNKPFYLQAKSIAPYAILAVLVFVVISTSDLPIFNWLPGKEHLVNGLVPYFGTLFALFKSAFSSKFVSWVFLIGFSAGMLALIDMFFSRRSTI